MKRGLIAFLVIFAFFTLLPACGGGDGDDTSTSPSSTESVSLSQGVQAIFNSTCVTGCHMPGGTSSFLNLMAGQSYGNLVGRPATRSGGTLVVQGNSSQSVLFQRVSGTSAGSRMPFGRSPLSSADQATIGNWIDQGAANN